MGVAYSLFFCANDSEKQTLHRRIMPTEEQFEAQTVRWNELAEYLLADLRATAGYPTRSWLQGSYKFGTQVRPPSRDEEFDIDLGVYFEWDGSTTDGNHEARELQALVQASLTKYAEDKEEITGLTKPPKKRCCRMHYTNNFHIDVPCYHLDRKRDRRSLATTDGWESSDPKALYIWFKKAFEETDRAKVRRQIRYMKAWAGLQWKVDEGRPSSVLLTVLVSDAAKNVSLLQPDDELLADILNQITIRLSSSAFVPNPAAMSENLNRLDATQNTEFLKRLTDFAIVAGRALRADDESIAAITWAEAFGHFFPMPDLEVKDESGRLVLKSQSLVPAHLPDVAVVAVNNINQSFRFSGTNSIGPIPKNCSIIFEVRDPWKLPVGTTVEWIVRNGGGEAETENDLGHSSGFGMKMTERSAYNGKHFMDAVFRAGGNIIGVRRIPVTVQGMPIPRRKPPRPEWVRFRGRR